jgi:hypothetical protein
MSPQPPVGARDSKHSITQHVCVHKRLGLTCEDRAGMSVELNPSVPGADC